MGWNNRVDVARHKALKVLKDAGAWEEIIVPTFQNMGTEEEDEEGTGKPHPQRLDRSRTKSLCGGSGADLSKVAGKFQQRARSKLE